MEIAFLLFDGIIPLDAIGPFEVLVKPPGAEIRMVAKKKGEVRTKGQSLAMIAIMLSLMSPNRKSLSCRAAREPTP